MDFITGEKIQTKCDLYIGNKQTLYNNPATRNAKDKHLCLDNESDFMKIKNKKNIFCYTDVLYQDFNRLYVLLKECDVSFNLYFHNSDYGFEEKHTELCSLSNLNRIYSQNLSIPATCQILPLPIGFANSMWEHGNADIIKQSINNINIQPVTLKSNAVYFYFDLHTKYKERQGCYQLLIEKKIENQPKLPFKDYLALLSTFEYAICPVGNGLDTHRFWECLYLKTVPICKKNVITEYFSKWFPVVLLDDWSDLDITQLNYKTESWINYPLLDMNSMIEYFA